MCCNTNRSAAAFFNSTFILILFVGVNHIGSVVVIILKSSAMDRKFDCRLGQARDYNIGIRCIINE